MKLAGVAAIATVLVCGAVACSSGGTEPDTASTQAAQSAAPTVVVTSATYPPRVAVHEDEFVAAMIKGDGRFLMVNPLGQADQICGKLDAGVDVQTVVDFVLQTLRTQFAAENPYPRIGWTEFDAQFLTGQAAINVCPAHEAAVRAAFK